MALKTIRQQVCDGCGQVVYGPDRASFVEKDYYTIEGKARMNFRNADGEWDYKFFTRAPGGNPDFAVLTFCMVPGLACQEAYMQQGRDWHEKTRQQYKEKMLRGEVAQTPVTRSRNDHFAAPPAQAPESYNQES